MPPQPPLADRIEDVFGLSHLRTDVVDDLAGMEDGLPALERLLPSGEVQALTAFSAAWAAKQAQSWRPAVAEVRACSKSRTPWAQSPARFAMVRVGVLSRALNARTAGPGSGTSSGEASPWHGRSAVLGCDQGLRGRHG